ncbi:MULTISPECIES: DUF6003 family protein [unclassified Streptomyces]|uniref:DUF6003 family protein n=1 Tax=unclassified Streptomyces TaxID=2593676 RepID=UPI002442F26B|nr:DUF6003 family protein [Streptomyces sp. DH41]MDG9728328.1 DUF6003 family protein [Streptomyces sp. DH41]
MPGGLPPAERGGTQPREALLTRVLAAGVPAHRVAELTGEELTTLTTVKAITR